ncbi:MAG TPA: SpoIID/LytB domain-containing protein [Vicinamibacterales bacterium]|nr:SpoIID/LytB domain-containing protein [Vicinamibacterales bacterium]
MVALLSCPGTAANQNPNTNLNPNNQDPNPNENRNPERRTLNAEPGVRVGLAKPGGGYTMVEMPLETYVARVLAGEAARDSPPAALEALAITIRTFARANRGRHRADGFDLCDQTHCQVVRAATVATERAASATEGRLLVRAGQPATVYYSASCGGHTAAPSEVWPGHDDLPYLPSNADDACAREPAWDAELRSTDLARALQASGYRGSLRAMKIAAHTASGRVAILRLDGLTPDRISGQDLRMAVGRTLGWQHIKSTAFELKKDDDLYRFSGHGSGHGVGLCVIGSARLAEQGMTAAKILARYFPGLEVTRELDRPITTAAATRPAPPAAAAPRLRPAPDVALSLPDEDEGDRAVIQREVVRARDELAQALGVPPPRVTVRFHPTTDDYERATGRAWFTSGAYVDGELHLLPLATLRSRDLLDRTIRHELVHVMIDGQLGTRPAWVKEGAAIYFAGGPPVASEPQRPAFRPDPRASCPTDSELLAPVSVGALANAFARARACFARQIAAGKTWKEIR